MDNNKHIPLRTIESTPALGNLDRICDMEEGRLSGKVFWDPAIYEQELEKIFARCWLFVAHESQLPKSGDYLTTSMGEDEVLVVRQKDASIKVFLNACPHRGNKVCFAEAGNARGFICNYHGWSFGADGGRLMGMHESKCYEESQFDKSRHGLREAREHVHRLFPADAAIGDALAVDQRLARDHGLLSGDEVAFHHHADDAGLTRFHLRGDVFDDLGLVVGVLAAVGMAGVDHEARGQARFR